MKVIVEAHETTESYRFPIISDIVLRIYANRPFETFDGQSVPAGSPKNPNSWFLPVPCSLNGTKLHIPSFEIDSTEDSPTDRSATYTAWLYAGNAQVGTVPWLTGFAVPALLDPLTLLAANQTWASLILHRDAKNPPPRQGVYDIGQVEYLITQALAFLRMASDTQVGMAAGSYPPVDPQFPIHVAQTDPLWSVLMSGQRLATASGRAVLADGSVVVGSVLAPIAAAIPTAEIIATSRSRNVTGNLRVVDVVDGVSFTIESTEMGDNGEVSWIITNPYP